MNIRARYSPTLRNPRDAWATAHLQRKHAVTRELDPSTPRIGQCLGRRRMREVRVREEQAARNNIAPRLDRHPRDA